MSLWEQLVCALVAPPRLTDPPRHLRHPPRLPAVDAWADCGGRTAGLVGYRFGDTLTLKVRDWCHPHRRTIALADLHPQDGAALLALLESWAADPHPVQAGWSLLHGAGEPPPHLQLVADLDRLTLTFSQSCHFTDRRVSLERDQVVAFTAAMRPDPDD